MPRNRAFIGHEAFFLFYSLHDYAKERREGLSAGIGINNATRLNRITSHFVSMVYIVNIILHFFQKIKCISGTGEYNASCKSITSAEDVHHFYVNLDAIRIKLDTFLGKHGVFESLMNFP